MIWLFVGAIGGLAVVGVAGWARRERKKVETETAARKERGRLQAEEAQLLARLRQEKGEE